MTEQEAISLFKCLADKSRMQILKSLMEEDMYVERLAERLSLTPATISFHLKKLEEYIEKRSDFEELSNKLEIFINLSLSVNTKNKEALRYSDIIEKKLTEVVETFAKVEKWISSIEDLDCIIEKSNILKEYKFLFSEIVEKKKKILYPI